MDYRGEIKELREKLNENARLYYTLDASTMSDYEYDRLYRRLQELEAAHPEEITPDSPTQRVGDAVLNDFAEVRHPVPLESLEDVFDGDEVKGFLSKVLETLPRAEYSVEPKVDGLSVALEYRDGRFYQGATRGDGRGGEDVTGNPCGYRPAFESAPKFPPGHAAPCGESPGIPAPAGSPASRSGWQTTGPPPAAG